MARSNLNRDEMTGMLSTVTRLVVPTIDVGADESMVASSVGARS